MRISRSCANIAEVLRIIFTYETVNLYTSQSFIGVEKLQNKTDEEKRKSIVG